MTVGGISQQLFAQTLARFQAQAQQDSVQDNHQNLKGAQVLQQTAARASQQIMDTGSQMLGSLVDITA